MAYSPSGVAGGVSRFARVRGSLGGTAVRDEVAQRRVNASIEVFGLDHEKISNAGLSS